jgi:hypothetical protein
MNIYESAGIIQVYQVSGLGKINLRSQVKGNPNKPVATKPGCPSECPESLELCEVCQLDQNPGNIALGLAFGIAAQAIGEGDAWLKGHSRGRSTPERQGDLDAYDLGADLRSGFKEDLETQILVSSFGGGLYYKWRSGARDRLKKLLCDKVKAGVKTGKIVEFPCDKCGQKWP